MKTKSTLKYILAFLVGISIPVLSVTAISCITPQTRQEIRDTQTEISKTKAEPPSDARDAKIAFLEDQLRLLQEKASQERLASAQGIAKDTSIAIEGLSPLAALAFPPAVPLLGLLAGLLGKLGTPTSKAGVA